MKLETKRHGKGTTRSVVGSTPTQFPQQNPWGATPLPKEWKDILQKELNMETLVERLRKRAAIRRQIDTRKSVQEGKPDRIADLLEEAATRIGELESLYEALVLKSLHVT